MMDNNSLQILYFGDDENFIDKAKSYYKEYLKLDGFFIRFYGITEEDDLLRELDDKEGYYSIWLDISNLNPHLWNIYKYFHMLNKWKRVNIFVLYKDKDQFEELLYLYKYGSIYSFIKDDDNEKLFYDTCYIQGNLESNPPRSHSTKAFDIYCKAAFLAEIDQIQHDFIKIKCNNLISPVFEISLPNFGDGQSRNYCLVQKNKNIGDTEFREILTLKIPFMNLYDDPSENSLNRDNFECWINNAKDDFFNYKLNIMVYTENVSIINEFKDIIKDYNISINLKNKINSDDLEELKKLQAPFIIIDIPENKKSNSKITYDEIAILIQSIKYEKYRPIIILFNVHTTSQGLQKSYGYQRILSNEETVKNIFLKKIFEVYIEKYFKVPSENYYLNTSSNIKYALVHQTVYIRNISEDEVIFESNEDLPLYSTLKIDIPVTYWITIIPAYKDLNVTILKFCYIGVINGLSKSDRKVLKMNIVVKNNNSNKV